MTLHASDLASVPTAIDVSTCTQLIIKKIETLPGFGLFGVIDHQENAKKEGMSLPAQQLIIFGNPKAGTKLLQTDAQIGYDLPLRIMVRQAGKQSVVEYRNPKVFKKNHNLKNSKTPAKMEHLLETLATTCK